MPVERSAWRNAPLQLDETILAIGDVHGCDRELALLLEELSPLAAERPARLIFLGDLICRGRSSLAALAFWAAPSLDQRFARGPIRESCCHRVVACRGCPRYRL